MQNSSVVRGYILRDPNGRHLSPKGKWYPSKKAEDTFVHTPEAITDLLTRVEANEIYPATAQLAIYEGDYVRTDGPPILFTQLFLTGVLKPPAGDVVANIQYGGAYAAELVADQQSGECRFCKQLQDPEVALHRAYGWIVKEVPKEYYTKTEWPKFTSENQSIVIPAAAHFLFMPERHMHPDDVLSPLDWLAVGTLFDWWRCNHPSPGGVFATRYGSVVHSGTTIRHRHFHGVVPPDWPADVPNPEGKKIVPVPFWVG
jgi:hypothetical protein